MADTVAAAIVPEALVIPRYGFADADRIARVSPGTARRWLAGYSYRADGGGIVSKPPVGTPRHAPDAAVSFFDLVEVAALRGLRRLGFSLPQIRTIVRNCRERFGSERPLLTQRFKVGGRDAFVQLEEALVDVLQGPRTAWDEVLDPFLETVGYQDGWAHRWWPLGCATNVVVDPQFGYGLPVVAGSGVRTEILFERREAGDSLEQIERDFGVASEALSDALEFERALVA